MERIKEVTRPTDKHCECTDKGNIVETFGMQYGRSNGVMGPGHFTPSWVLSTGFRCEKCGRLYGGPSFPSKLTGNPKLKKELEFELSLSTGILKRPITVDDLPDINNGKWKKVRNSNHLTWVDSIKRPKKIDKALKKLAIGTVVYYTPQPSEEIYNNPHNQYGLIQLLPVQNSPTYRVRYACFD